MDQQVGQQLGPRVGLRVQVRNPASGICKRPGWFSCLRFSDFITAIKIKKEIDSNEAVKKDDPTDS